MSHASSKPNRGPQSEAKEYLEFMERYKELKRCVRSGATKPSIVDEARALQKLLDEGIAQRITPRDEYQARALICEVFEHLGRYDEARDAARFAHDLGDTLPGLEEAAALPKQDRDFVRVKARYYLALARIEFRTYKYSMALSRVDAVLLALAGLASDKTGKERELPSLGTMGAAYCLAGRIRRELGDLPRAKNDVKLAIDHYSRRSELWKSGRCPEEVRDQQIRFSIHRMGICHGIGLSSIALATGDLKVAREELNNALPLLELSRDDVAIAHAKLLSGQVSYFEAGSNLDELERSLALLNEARRAFKRLGHMPFKGQADFDRAKVWLYLGDAKRAWIIASAVEERAEKSNDHRLRARALVLLSRIARSMKRVASCLQKPQQESIRMAEKAIVLSRQHGLPTCETEAEIALGQARLNAGHVNGAIQALHRALALANANSDPSERTPDSASPVLRGVCHVYLAWCYARVGEPGQADRHMTDWSRLEPRIQLKRLLERAQRVREIVKNVPRDFVVKRDDANINIKHHTKWLADELYVWARERFDGNITKMAAALGIHRSTVSAHEKKARIAANSSVSQPKPTPARRRSIKRRSQNGDRG